MQDLVDPLSEFEAAGAAEREKYAIASRLEIGQILHGLMRRAALLTAYFEGGNNFFLTSVVAVDATANLLLFEAATEAPQNQRILAAQRIRCIGSLDKIQIQFVCNGMTPATHNDHPVFRTTLPHELLRMQRREHYRIQTPVISPLKCTITTQRESGPVTVALSILDLSCGGLSVLTPPEEFTPELGSQYPCTILLPGVGSLQTAIEARNAYAMKLPNGKQTQRTGFAYVNPPEQMLAALQRYIMKLERERKLR